jgi:hypothetical protein
MLMIMTIRMDCDRDDDNDDSKAVNAIIANKEKSRANASKSS